MHTAAVNLAIRLLLPFALCMGTLALVRGLGVIDGSWVPGVIAAVLVTRVATFMHPKAEWTF